MRATVLFIGRHICCAPPPDPNATTPSGKSLMAPCDSELKGETLNFLYVLLRRLQVSIEIGRSEVQIIFIFEM